MKTADYIALFAALISVLSFFVSYWGYRVAKKAQQESENGRKVDESRKQFIVEIVSAMQRSTDFWSDELIKQINAGNKNHKSTYTLDEIANMEEIPSREDIPEYDFEFVELELSLVNLYHTEKRLNKIEAHIDFSKAGWFDKSHQWEWLKYTIKKRWRSSKLVLWGRFIKYYVGEKSNNLLTIQVIPPDHVCTYEVNPFVAEYFDIVSRVHIDGAKATLIDSTTHKPVSFKKPFIFNVGSKKYFWTLILSMKSKTARSIIEELRLEPSRVKIFLYFDDGEQEISTSIRRLSLTYILPEHLRSKQQVREM